MEKQKRSYSECICEQCGKIYEKADSEIIRNLKKGRKSFCSISCAMSYRNLHQLSEKSKEHRQNFIQQYAGKITRSLDEFSPFKETLRRAKRHAKEHNRECTITWQDLKDLWEKQEGKCVYTNLNLVLPIQGRETPSITVQASLDRIDSSKGYIPGNIQFVSSCINMLKNKLSDLETKRFLKEISSFTSTFVEDQTISSSQNEMSDALAGN